MKPYQSKNLFFLCLLFLVVLLQNCSAQPDIIIPPEQEVHFPGLLSISGSNLIITGLNSDHKHSYARMIFVETNNLAKIINSQEEKQPISWSKVVSSNTLIAGGASNIISRPEFVAFVNRENKQFIISAVISGKLSCNNPQKNILDCTKSSKLELSGADAFSLDIIHESVDKLIFVVGYLSSDFISLVNYNKNSRELKLVKNINISSWVKSVDSGDNLKNYRYITRKIKTTASKIYILVERHEKESDTSVRPLGARLFSFSVDNFLNQNLENIMSLDLAKFAIDGAQDFYIDEAKQEIIILAKIPEALVKINLDNKKLLQSEPTCRGGTSIFVDDQIDNIIVPCFYDNRVGFFSKLSLKRKSDPGVLGRGPTHVAIDPNHNFIFVSMHDGGRVIILDRKTRELKPAYLFNGAPENRAGS